MESVADKLMRDPTARAMLQERLDDMVGSLSGYYESLPKVVKDRVKALKKLQVDFLKMEAKCHQEIHTIEVKYNEMYKTLMAKRAEIASGAYEPTPEECDFPSDTEDEEDDKKEAVEGGEPVSDKVKVENEEKMDTDTEKKDEANMKGIPEFWLTIFKNVPTIGENIQDYDEPVLKHLTDITIILADNPMSFTLEFHFSPNEFFTNSVLTKTYLLKNEVDEKDPFSYEGPEIKKPIGCKIDWNPGKSTTMRTVTKKQKHKTKGSIRTLTQDTPVDSFFNFFSPPEENEEELDDDARALIVADFELGELIRHRIVPRAVLYFTGEALLDDDEFDDDEDDDYQEEFESESSDEDGDEGDENAVEGSEPKKKSKNRMAKGEKPQECKQQ
ncbi:nucleosome assembly protein 1-like 1-A isoform X2 [Brevipalpus obovatus]|uniref:nucleosome assembly protein 1-like 1-A isoform X2 n=2 Tax=Brevipalpus obovatus TaxID=246614 RepID=UPI003D9DD727